VNDEHLDRDFCRQCKRIVAEGTNHDWVSHQPKRLQPVLRELRFNSALSVVQLAAVEMLMAPAH
jgi:predicted Fe-S protein YdhL (DUF1289 family)